MWAAEPALRSSTDLTREGYFVLSWDLADGEDPDGGYILQQATSPDFRQTLDRPIPASGDITITGLADGNYYFRAGPGDGEWSNTVQVTVEHHALSRAFGFFSAGFGLFAVLCATIFWGNARTRGDNNAV